MAKTIMGWTRVAINSNDSTSADKSKYSMAAYIYDSYGSGNSYNLFNNCCRFNIAVRLTALSHTAGGTDGRYYKSSVADTIYLKIYSGTGTSGTLLGSTSFSFTTKTSDNGWKKSDDMSSGTSARFVSGSVSSAPTDGASVYISRPSQYSSETYSIYLEYSPGSESSDDTGTGKPDSFSGYTTFTVSAESKAAASTIDSSATPLSNYGAPIGISYTGSPAFGVVSYDNKYTFSIIATLSNSSTVTLVSNQSVTSSSYLSAQTVTYTPPLSIANELSSTSTTIDVTEVNIYTYLNGSLIGSNKSSLSGPAYFELTSTYGSPSVYIDSTSFNNSGTGFNDYPIVSSDSSGISTNITTSVSGDGKYNATITSYDISIGGNSQTSTSTSFTSNVTSTGYITISVTATDSRGFTSSSSTSMYVYPYSKPSISFNSVYRVKSDGTSSTSGGYAGYSLTGSGSYLSGENTVSMDIRARKHTDNSYVTIATGSGIVLSSSGAVTKTASYFGSLVAISRSSAYTFEARITDIVLGESGWTSYDNATIELDVGAEAGNVISFTSPGFTKNDDGFLLGSTNNMVVNIAKRTGTTTFYSCVVGYRYGTTGDNVYYYKSGSSTGTTSIDDATRITSAGNVTLNLLTDDIYETTPIESTDTVNFENGIYNPLNLVCISIEDGEEIGDSEISVKAYGDESKLKPTIDAINVSDPTNIWSENFVQNYSKANINTSCGGNYNATLSQVSVQVGSQSVQTYTPKTESYTLDYTSSLLLNSGNTTITVIATDSRGLVTTKQTTQYIYPYTTPQITSGVRFYRCNSSGEEVDDGDGLSATGIAWTVPYAFSTLENPNTGILQNSWSLTFTAPDPTDSTKTVELFSIDNQTTNHTGTLESYYWDDDKLYDSLTTYRVTIKLVDTIVSNGITTIETLTTTFALMDFNKNGQSMALGQTSKTNSKNLLEIAFDTQFTHVPTIPYKQDEETGDVSFRDFISIAYPKNSVFVSTVNTAPTMYGTTWASVGQLAVGEITLYFFQRTNGDE